jgi:hypothetical protein
MVKKFNLQHYLTHLKNPNKQKLQQQLKEEINDCGVGNGRVRVQAGYGKVQTGYGEVQTEEVKEGGTFVDDT